MMTTSAAPPSLVRAQSSEPHYVGGLGNKAATSTQEPEQPRRERGFTECLQFLMPIYLLPFVFGNTEGVGIYCVLVTLVCLMGALIPPAVAAMLPILLVPLTGICTTDTMAAEYLGPRVLEAWLLFAVAIVGDETTLFWRMCLHALHRCALHMQPLFLFVQLAVLVFSLFLPSSFIVVFGIVLIERFVVTTGKEIIGADQRSGIRAPPTTSSQNMIENLQRPRWPQIAAKVVERRARSVSVASDTTVVSAGSGCSSIVRHYKLHPEWQEDHRLDRAKLVSRRHSRKTFFDPFDRTSTGRVWACRLPCRTIRSATGPKQPSSILKSSSRSALGEPTVGTKPKDGDAADNFSATPISPTVTSTGKADEGAITRTNRVRTKREETKAAGKPTKVRARSASTPSAMQPLLEVTEAPEKPGAKRYVERRDDSRSEAATDEGPERAHSLDTASSLLTPATSPFTPSSHSGTPQKSLRSEAYHSAQSRGDARNAGEYATWASQVMGGAFRGLLLDGGRPMSVRSTKSAAADAEPSHTLSEVGSKDKSDAVDHSVESLFEAEESGHNVIEVLQRVHDRSIEDLHELRMRRASGPSVPEISPPGSAEVRGVLKVARRNVSLQLNATLSWHDSTRCSPSSMDDDDELPASTPSGPHLSGAPGRDEDGNTGQPDHAAAGRRTVLGLQPVFSDTPAGEGASSLFNFDYEQLSSSVRLRALILALRPAFIAGTSYTAIFGNLLSFTAVPTHSAVLRSLDCHTGPCPVNWWKWLAVALPVSLSCCLVCWAYAYFAFLGSCDEEIEEQTHEDMARCARARLRNMKRRTLSETLLIYWLIAIPVAYLLLHPKRFLQGPLLSGLVVAMSIMPASTLRKCWGQRMLCWRCIAVRMPWNVIFMLGSVMALAKVVQQFRLVETILHKLDDDFWAGRSVKGNQFILVSLAALLSEVVVGDTLADILMPEVVRVAVVTDAPISHFVVPVSMAASINVIMPVSLPILIFREYLNVKCLQMVVYGLFLKCAAVMVIFVSMNTIGALVFTADKKQGGISLGNTTNVDGVTA